MTKKFDEIGGIICRKFHQQTNSGFPIGVPPIDPQYWPKEWTEIHHKTYPRFPKTKLSEKLLDLGNLKTILESRFSMREFDTKKYISFEELSTLLYYSAGVRPKNQDMVRRFYPSGGARYPLEVYVAIQRVDGMTPGIYHYNVKDNLLEALTTDPQTMDSLLEGLTYDWSREAAALVFITAVWERNLVKYKKRGYRLILMESGHLAHNIALTATSLGIGCCNSIGFHNQRINEVLDIENEDEDSIYMAILGR